MPAPASQPTVLVIDDDRVIRLVVRETLGAAGFTVLEAEDGEVGLQMAVEARPALVILDIMLPRLDGLAVLAAMQEEQLDVPVLVFSATGSSNADRARTLGATRYLAKPFDLDDLAATVREMLGEHRSAA